MTTQNSQVGKSEHNAKSNRDLLLEIDNGPADVTRISHECAGRSFEKVETGDSFAYGSTPDGTDRTAGKRELEPQRDELATLDRINELLLETVHDLVQRSNRESVERRVCERLTESEFYQFAWVGEPTPEGSHIQPRVTAGEDGGYLDEVTRTTDRGDTGVAPAGRALRTADVQVVTVDAPASSPWQVAARERGFASVAAVPLQHQGAIYSVLSVYTSREDAFAPRERVGFDVIGRTGGAVIDATRSHNLLFAEEIVEMEFDITAADCVFTRTASGAGCELSLDGYVASGEQWILYCALEGASPSTVADTVAANPEIDSCRVVSAEDPDTRIELVHTGHSILDAVADAGASVRSGTATPNSARMTIEAPMSRHVRSIVHDIQAEYPAAKLLAQREHDHEITAVGRPDGLLDDLTDRQCESLEAAYRAGYFDWPRESTAEQVADSLDLSPPTLHGHLRKAEETILSALLEGD